MKNKYFYKINKSLTNRYDLNPLKVVGFIEVFKDKEKKEKITDISFQELKIELLFMDCPHTSREVFDKFIENKVLEGLELDEIQNKIKEVEIASSLNLFDE